MLMIFAVPYKATIATKYSTNDDSSIPLMQFFDQWMPMIHQRGRMSPLPRSSYKATPILRPGRMS
jgi:hypothetical protein